MSDNTFWSVCTKCGHSESSEYLLSRWCPRCNYMRGVRRTGETPEEGLNRDAKPWTGEEWAQLTFMIFGTSQ